jgi:CBS domain-containing membrane protein
LKDIALRGLQIFRPILAGANLRDRLVACAGALAGIVVTALVFAAAPLDAFNFPLLVAPAGASAVLLFAVPTSPMAQPWPIIGGNVLSALVGVMVVQALGQTAFAAGIAVAGAILVMSLCRCLHPPGGAAALSAVVGPPSLLATGYAYPLLAVSLNLVVLVAAGWAFHRLSGRAYPHRPETPATPQATLHRADIDRALADLGETFDIDPDDLALLLQTAERHAEARTRAAIFPTTRRGA